MSISYFVRYDIAVGDLEAFLKRYREVHVPLVARWPGLRRMTMHTPLDWTDTAPGAVPRVSQTARGAPPIRGPPSVSARMRLASGIHACATTLAPLP